MKKITKITLMLFGLVLAVSCETTELEGLLDNPNALPPENISLNDGMNGVQLSFNGFTGIQGVGAQATRINYMFGSTYQNAFGPGTGGGSWNNAYASILLDSELLLDLSVTLEAPMHEGVLRMIRAYTLMTLVDYWGDVPFEEALQGLNNFNPGLSGGAVVYAAALDEINLGLTALEAGLALTDGGVDDTEIPNNIPGGSEVENFFFESAANELEQARAWIKFGNSLKFKYHLNLGNTAALNTLITEDNMISSNADSMAFRYFGVNDPPSRHPTYAGSYGAGQPTNYMNNSYMFAMVGANETNGLFGGGGNTIDPNNGDPRRPYYFFRQDDEFPLATDNPSLGDALPCADDASPYPAGVAFCSFGDGYWGRDHGDASGIPPDGNTRTVFGTYPIGGTFDDGSGGAIGDEDGLNGAGVNPILMASQMDLMRAEAAIVLGTSDNAMALTQSGVQKSLDYVTSFDDGAPDATAGYVAAVMAGFAGNEIETVAEQMWIASFGSGTEMYNFYRRNGEEAISLQPHLLGNGAGAFPNSMFYPNATADLNLSVPQKSDLTQRVFWDTNNRTVQ